VDESILPQAVEKIIAKVLKFDKILLRFVSLLGNAVLPVENLCFRHRGGCPGGISVIE
jgi:hypothetical protein